ncbi:hypothetical protein [Methanobacterium formicicum]|uniref:Uncharacterized protein n=1 Tax=Methanobacterium formicicum TaxID=2162 RepID=A0A090I9W9_METFO|nr:hypothetical protein [Methanobacterium formicicum]MBF4475926.1 hypothetical protein [Methanobacterium formicicum]MDH2658952.1 hypothetical protein [Methanobacterium formicicum]CEA14172.1 hypothetical protein DSM1535_1847 [Methanobacterium formicicum]
MNKVPRSILEEIQEETHQKLKDNEDFDSELISKLRKLDIYDSIPNERKLISILRGESP